MCAAPSRLGPSRPGRFAAGPSQSDPLRPGPSRTGPFSWAGAASRTGPSGAGPSRAGPSGYFHGFVYRRLTRIMCVAGLYSPNEPYDLRPLQTIVTTSPALAELAAELESCDHVGLDTEFLRERTYRAELCLVQLSSRSDAWCVDPLALPDLTPLAQILTIPAI